MKAAFSETDLSQNLETGIDIIDTQHRRYFDLLNKYLDKTTESSTVPEEILDLAETFNFLREYAKEHFSTEESIMEETEYPGFESHQEQHIYFSYHVEQLYNRMKFDGFSPDLAREVNYYTVEWFIEHIRTIDVKLAEFLKEKNIKNKKITSFLKKSIRISIEDN